MRRPDLLIAACLICGAACAAETESEVTITQDRFTPGSKFSDDATQFVTVHNGTTAKVNARVSCGFMRGQQLIGTGHDWAVNLETGQNGFLKITTDIGAPAPDRAECRVERLQ
jgi:hypothetical protein